MTMQKLLVAVTAVGCLSRFRNGMQFNTKPKQISVTEHELAILQTDSYLNVKVLEDDTVVDENAGEDPTADTGTNDSDDKKPDESGSSKPDDLTVIVEAMQALHIDPAGDKPTVAYLKEQGLEVTAKQRDAAWDLLVASTKEANA